MGEALKRATIQTAINNDILLFDEDSGWYTESSEGSRMGICSVPPQMLGEKEEVVIGYIMENKEYLDLIESASNKDKRKKTKKAQEKKKFSRPEGIKKAVDLGWNEKEVWKMKNDKIQYITDNNVKPTDTDE